MVGIANTLRNPYIDWCVWDESPSVSSWGQRPQKPSRFFLPAINARPDNVLTMYLCYIDESGTSGIPGNTSHFVLTGISIPIWHWTNCDDEIGAIKRRYDLADAEIHTAWILRKYLEQSKIADFYSLNQPDRKSAVDQYRRVDLLRLQKGGNAKRYRQAKKNYDKTATYVHLTLAQRRQFIADVAECVSNWGFARLFAECVDKIHFDPNRARVSLDEQAFEQVVSRFDRYLQVTEEPGAQPRHHGLLIHDNNQTVAKKHTQLMKQYHRQGTLWTNTTRIIETPLFVDSELTGMVQIADLCSYAIRRYLENDETALFKRVFQRADRHNGLVVGVRHFSADDCSCQICQAHTP